MALLIVDAAAFFLAAAVPLAPPAAPAVATGKEEFLWRPGYWYCAHFAVSGRDMAHQHPDPRSRAKTLTVHRSEVAEEPILVSTRGTLAELPRLFALELERRAPELRPVWVTDVQCYHFQSRRNLNAQIERQTGLGASKLLYRGERLAKVTKLVVVPDFAATAILSLKRWKPSPGSTIYQPAPCRSREPSSRRQTRIGATCRPLRR